MALSKKPRPAVLSLWLVLVGIGPGLAADAAGQSIYKRVDAEGRVHYSDRHSGANAAPVILPPVNTQQPVQPIAIDRASRSTRRVVTQTGKATGAALAKCNNYRSQIREIERRLRQGYTEPGGSRLRQRKRDWADLLYRHCYR